MIRVAVNDTAVRALLARTRAAAAHPEPVLRAAGTTLLSLILGNFSAHGAGFRPAPWPPKADGSPATLKQSGTLSSSFRLAVTPTAATISNPMPYAAIHQPHRVERLHLPVLRTLKAPLRLVWNKRRVAVRPFLDELASRLTEALRNEAGRCDSLA